LDPLVLLLLGSEIFSAGLIVGNFRWVSFLDWPNEEFSENFSVFLERLVKLNGAN